MQQSGGWFPVPGRLNSHMANLLVSFDSSCKKGGGVGIRLQHVLSHKTASFLWTNTHIYNLSHKCMDVCSFSRSCQKICPRTCLFVSTIQTLQSRTCWRSDIAELSLCLVFVFSCWPPASRHRLHIHIAMSTQTAELSVSKYSSVLSH